jgi:hypothetical protein
MDTSMMEHGKIWALVRIFLFEYETRMFKKNWMCHFWGEWQQRSAAVCVHGRVLSITPKTAYTNFLQKFWFDSRTEKLRLKCSHLAILHQISVMSEPVLAGTWKYREWRHYSLASVPRVSAVLHVYIDWTLNRYGFKQSHQTAVSISTTATERQRPKLWSRNWRQSDDCGELIIARQLRARSHDHNKTTGYLRTRSHRSKNCLDFGQGSKDDGQWGQNAIIR